VARVLIACEYSGRVRDAFAAAGHDALSCDLLPTESYGPHLQGDVRQILDFPWDMLIAHPPCTRLCNSGVRWLSERDLWDELREAAAFFKLFLDATHIPMRAVENPVMHKHALALVGRKHDFSLQPWEHGEPYSKRTCFWTHGLPPLKPSKIVAEREQAVWKMGPSETRWKDRSRTYPGVAKAMASQWGYLLRVKEGK
jgi:hypothetical protein